MSQEDTGIETPDIQDSESLGSALDEIRRRYDDEERRRSSINTDISGMLGLNTLLFSIITALQGQGNPQHVLYAQLILILSGLLSFLAPVFGHRIWGKYSRPLQSPGHIYAKAQKSKSEFNDDFLELYAESCADNEAVNNCKRRFLAFNFIVTAIAIGVAAAGAMLG